MASTALPSLRTVRGVAVASSCIVISSTSPPLALSARRRSPSVKVPLSLLAPSTTSTHPHPLELSSTRTFTSLSPGPHSGRSFVFITSFTLRMRRFPMRPAGWFIAYSSFVRFFACMMATAHVSPKSIWIAVEVTGARSNGHSSRSSGRHTCMSHTCASFDPVTELTPTSFAPFARAYGMSLSSSSVAPLLEKSTRTSSSPTMPMSPCSASVGERKTDLVPVLTSVIEIFCAMNPDLPTPLKNTTPLVSSTT
mmetsp:Transcript_9249/g.30546  ORF Transcript_9249/g.30546 Transcript_9249/m.30546 type:complete len:252 (-) Transcript_9249:106-861(-)